MAKRRGMLIKNVSERPLAIQLTSRLLEMTAGEEVLVTPEEVRDAGLRDPLQSRIIAVVRPATPEEAAGLYRQLRGEEPSTGTARA